MLPFVFEEPLRTRRHTSTSWAHPRSHSSTTVCCATGCFRGGAPFPHRLHIGGGGGREGDLAVGGRRHDSRGHLRGTLRAEGPPLPAALVAGRSRLVLGLAGCSCSGSGDSVRGDDPRGEESLSHRALASSSVDWSLVRQEEGEWCEAREVREETIRRGGYLCLNHIGRNHLPTSTEEHIPMARTCR